MANPRLSGPSSPRAAAFDSVRRLAYDSIGDVFFTGPLASFSPAERMELLTWADLTANSTRLSHTTFKDVLYLVIVLPADGNLWNDLRVKRNERVGKLIGDQFAMLKAFAKLSLSQSAIGGLKLEEPSCHGTAPSYRDRTCDRIEAHFGLAPLLQFRNADLTSQQLIDQSIILVNGDRVQLDLTEQ